MRWAAADLATWALLSAGIAWAVEIPLTLGSGADVDSGGAERMGSVGADFGFRFADPPGERMASRTPGQGVGPSAWRS